MERGQGSCPNMKEREGVVMRGMMLRWTITRGQENSKGEGSEADNDIEELKECKCKM
jgi:hypothetical protein